MAAFAWRVGKQGSRAAKILSSFRAPSGKRGDAALRLDGFAAHLSVKRSDGSRDAAPGEIAIHAADAVAAEFLEAVRLLVQSCNTFGQRIGTVGSHQITGLA